MTDLDALFALLPEHRAHHAARTPLFAFLRSACETSLRGSALSQAAPVPFPFGPFGEILFPYRRMGAVDSIDLFGLHELILFAFYDANRGRYRRVVDIGANLGLHSLVLARCGFTVEAYEPDPVHAELLRGQLAANAVAGVGVVEAAVSDRTGTAQFVRVKGNTTGSHLAGAKADPYGDLDRFEVQVRPFAEAVAGADLVKIDAEGHECVLLRSLPLARWEGLDALVEVGTRENADILMTHFAGSGVNLFSQTIGWERASTSADLPHSHREGSLFISRRPAMPWRKDDA